MASLVDLQNALVKADAAGDVEGAKALATHIKWLMDPAGGNYQAPANPTGVMPAMDPSTGGGTLSIGPYDTGIKTPEVVDRTLSGMGQVVDKLGTGIQQRVSDLFGSPQQAETGSAALQAQEAEARKRDAPLNSTVAGTLGNLGMNVLSMVPTLAVPGSAGLVGSALMGAGLGALQPTTSQGETAANIGIGAVGGPVGVGASKLVGGLTGGVSNLLQAFTAGGRDNILGKTMIRAAGGNDAAPYAINAMTAAPSLPGVQNTVGMTSGNAGLAGLQRGVASLPDQAELFDARNRQNANAILDAVGSLGGDSAALASAKAARSAAATPFYQAASPQVVQTDAALKSLLERPSMQTALAKARELAKEKGQSITDASGNYTVGGLQWVKMALDDMAKPAGGSALGVNQINAIKDTRADLLSWLGNASPEFAQGNAAFAKNSQPVNAIKTGNALSDLLSPAFNDVKTAKVVNGSKFSTALANGDATAQKATGFPGATLDTVFQPAQLDTLNGANRALGQMSDAMTLGKPPGSDTMKNLLVQQMLAGSGGGMGDAFAKNVFGNFLLGNTVGRVAHVAVEPALQNRLAQILLNPDEAKQVMLKAMPNASPLQLQQAADQLTQFAGRSLLDFSEQRGLQPTRRQ